MQTQINIRHNIQKIYTSNTCPKGIHGNTSTLILGVTNDDSDIGHNSKITFTTNTSNTHYISVDAYNNNYTLIATIIGNNTNITLNPSDNYLYDANGNMTQNNNKLIQWTSFNKPKRFTSSNDTTAFAYAPNRNRYQKTQTKANSNTTITTTYIGKLYEQIKQNTHTEHKHFIYADGQLIAINIKTDTTANSPSIPDKTRYLHYDNLGSIDTITDGQGNIVERMAYTAFGQRRQGDWRANDPLLPIIPTLTNRGFTGHEHIDEMGFIHMNGRVYDPQIGRFLGADPTIQHPYSTQDYNRYSYTTNNPLKYVDMNGFGWFSEARRNIANSKKYGRQITSIGVLFIFPGVNIYAAGFLSSMIDSKGDLKQGGLSAFTAGFNAGVLHPMKAGFGKLIAHGLTGGICSRLSGGSFKSGFLELATGYGASWSGAYEAAGVSSQAVTWGQRAQNVVASYVVGGVAAELGDGKFKNGGMSVAFSRMFNDLTDDFTQSFSNIDDQVKNFIAKGADGAEFTKKDQARVNNIMKAITVIPVVRGTLPLANTTKGVYYRSTPHIPKVVDFIGGKYIPPSQPSNWPGIIGTGSSIIPRFSPENLEYEFWK